MAGQFTKSGLSSAQQTLLDILHRINFGRIQNLHVIHGEPAFNPAPLIHREVKFGGDNAPRPERLKGDYALKSQFVELFDELRLLGDGVVDLIEVKNGLPFRMLVKPAK